jgi:hypothetical protein
MDFKLGHHPAFFGLCNLHQERYNPLEPAAETGDSD